MIQLTLSQWALLYGALMPLVVGLVTKLNASAALKAVMLLALDSVASVLTEFFSTPTDFNWQAASINAVAALIVSVASYYGLLKHTVSPPLNQATANVGLGGQRGYDLAQ